MEDFEPVLLKIVKKYNKDGEICNDDELVYAQTTDHIPKEQKRKDIRRFDS